MAKLIIEINVDNAALHDDTGVDPVMVADLIERHVTTPLHDGYGFAYVTEHGLRFNGNHIGTVRFKNTRS